MKPVKPVQPVQPVQPRHVLSKIDAARIVGLLGVLQDLLESEIDCHEPPRLPEEREIIRVARRRWNAAEGLVKKLSARPRR